MNISEAETGTMKLKQEPVDLTLLVEDARELYQSIAEGKKFPFPVPARPAVLVVQGDRTT